METTKKKTLSAQNMAYIALAAGLMSVCAWISIPAAVPFTLQTMALFCLISLLGGKRVALALVVYCLLGAVGLPVFAGFRGGVGVLLGATGGYIVGFFCPALCAMLSEKIFPKNIWALGLALLVGLILCYAFGTAWFMFIYAQKTGPIGLSTALSMCVIPFILPDLVKLFVGVALGARVRSALKW